MAGLSIVLGSKRYSSWSLRGWLALKQTGAAFDEIVVPLGEEGTRAAILAHSPAGKVPVLKDGAVVVWESLAIGEYLAERFPEAGLWPKDGAARAHARSIAAEMHAGFANLRRDMPMKCTDSRPGVGHTPEALADAARIQAIWRDARGRFGAGGPFLFGRFSVADAMYAPVVFRFATYRPPLDPASQAYVETMTALPAMREWVAAAAKEPRIAKYEP